MQASVHGYQGKGIMIFKLLETCHVIVTSLLLLSQLQMNIDFTNFYTLCSPFCFIRVVHTLLCFIRFMFLENHLKSNAS
jgi:hypothetical protein